MNFDNTLDNTPGNPNPREIGTHTTFKVSKNADRKVPLIYPEGFWLQKLEKIEAVLPSLLKYPEIWKSVDVSHDVPRVQRIWTQLGSTRILLHRISPCGSRKPLYHPHPWASAVRVLHNQYHMEYGIESEENAGGTNPPPVQEVRIYKPGDGYEMGNFREWHSVSPVKECDTLMVIGPLWYRLAPFSSKKLSTLSELKKKEMIATFEEYYRA